MVIGGFGGFRPLPLLGTRVSWQLYAPFDLRDIEASPFLQCSDVPKRSIGGSGASTSPDVATIYVSVTWGVSRLWTLAAGAMRCMLPPHGITGFALLGQAMPLAIEGSLLLGSSLSLGIF